MESLEIAELAPYSFHTFSTMLLSDLLTRYNFLDAIPLSGGILLMVNNYLT